MAGPDDDLPTPAQVAADLIPRRAPVVGHPHFIQTGPVFKASGNVPDRPNSVPAIRTARTTTDQAWGSGAKSGASASGPYSGSPVGGSGSTSNTRNVQDTGLGPSTLDPSADNTSSDPNTQPSPFAEIGASGLAQYGGFVRDEFLPQLQGDRGLRVFREMYDNDPIVGALVFTIQMLLRKVEWRVEPPEAASVEGIVAARQQQRLQMLAQRRQQQQAQLMTAQAGMAGAGGSGASAMAPGAHPTPPGVAPQPKPAFATPLGGGTPAFHEPLTPGPGADPHPSASPPGTSSPGTPVAGPLGHPAPHPAGTGPSDSVTSPDAPGNNPPSPVTAPGTNFPTPNTPGSNPGGGPNQSGALAGRDGLPGSRPPTQPSPMDPGSDVDSDGDTPNQVLRKAALIRTFEALSVTLGATSANELMKRVGLFDAIDVDSRDVTKAGTGGGQFSGDIEALDVGPIPTDPESGEPMDFPVGTDPLAPPSPQEIHAMELAVFVETCLHDMVDSWADTISQIITMIVYGFAYHEIVYKKRNGPNPDNPVQGSKFADGRIGWAKIAGRAQETRHRWEFDEYGNVLGMWQLAPPKFQLKYIPMAKALLFRTTGYKQNPEGRSILRSAYRPWYFKRRIEEIEAIGVERDLAGIPVAYVPYQWLSAFATPEESASLNAMKEIVKNVRIDEQAGLVFPSIYDPDTKAQLLKFELLSNQGGKKSFDTDKIIGRYDQRIAMVALVDFILLGHESVGSKSLADTKTDLFTAALEAWLAVISDTFNTYAIPRLMQMNGLDPAMSPTLTFGKLARVSVTELGGLLTALAGAGADLFPDQVLEDYVREAAGMPPKQASDDL